MRQRRKHHPVSVLANLKVVKDYFKLVKESEVAGFGSHDIPYGLEQIELFILDQLEQYQPFQIGDRVVLCNENFKEDNRIPWVKYGACGTVIVLDWQKGKWKLELEWDFTYHVWDGCANKMDKKGNTWPLSTKNFCLLEDFQGEIFKNPIEGCTCEKYLCDICKENGITDSWAVKRHHHGDCPVPEHKDRFTNYNKNLLPTDCPTWLKNKFGLRDSESDS